MFHPETNLIYLFLDYYFVDYVQSLCTTVYVKVMCLYYLNGVWTTTLLLTYGY